MNATIEKIQNITISNNKEETPKKVEKNKPKEDQYCLKMLDYFVF
ncbi:hypothetical protein [Clostridium thailandense]